MAKPLRAITHMRNKRPRRAEQAFHISLVRTLELVLTEETFFFHVPNGGYRTDHEACMFRAMGVKAGVPDIILIHRGRAFGLELKSEEGRLNPAQTRVMARLEAAGMPIGVAHAADEALAIIDGWGIPTKIKRREAA